MGKKSIHDWRPLRIMKISRLLFILIYVFSRVPRFTTALMYLLRPLYEPTRETWLNRKFRYGLLTLGGGLLAPEVFRAYGSGARAFVENFNSVFRAHKKGEPIVWVEWILNAEILESFYVTSMCSALLNIFANVESMAAPSQIIEEAENQGTPVEYCSAMKLNMGAYLLHQIPKPDLIIAGSHPCDTNVSIAQTMEYVTGAPSYFFDVPYWKDDDSFRYTEAQIWEQIEFLEKRLGKKIDWERLKDMLERVNRFNFYLGEICEMHKAIPCPGTMINLGYAWVVREVSLRSPHALAMAKGLYEAVKKNYLAGKGVVRHERVRVLLWFPPIAFFTYLFKWMEHEFGAVIVADFIGQVSTVPIDTSNKETMIRDLARTQMHLAMGRQCHGPVEFITDEMVKYFEQYSIDCMIFTGHQGCKHGWAAVKIIQDICRERNMPALFLNIDIMDQRCLDEQGVKNEITKFFRVQGWA
ncbi:MAG TPA: 2-hydroxyacyl-CoA dehydratase family protein [Spirochaetota bacterium]|nr:2-hydroxyacyl-CoA dehydratase family protein [Spirochaetota bacterium]HPI89360.1 2-hydroxyacyl-CoA dehydratase family protein [Spirochaetota bacterium]HPR48295.1 2-hydroxyacyl-CoA dehydratase family protein [Spirochaetota bacterium]